MWVWVKTCAKSTFHAITDYCIIGTYSVSPTFRPSLKLILLSCMSNEDPNSFTAEVLVFVYRLYRKCNTDTIQ